MLEDNNRKQIKPNTVAIFQVRWFID